VTTDAIQGTFPANPTRSLIESRRLRNALFTKTPSTTGQLAKFKQLQSRSPPAFFFDRPPEAAAVTSLTLLHPAFGTFVHDCDTYCLTPEDNQLVVTLWRKMSGFFKEEKDRAAAFWEALVDHGIDMAASGIGSYQTDGDMRIKGLCFAILEAKAELSSGLANPMFQAASYYVASMRKTSEKYSNAQLPNTLIYLFGQLQSIWLCGSLSDMPVHGLILGSEVQSTQIIGPGLQALCPVLPLFWHVTDVEMHQRAPWCFGALRNVTQSLHRYYVDELPTIQTLGHQTSLQDPRYPYPTSYISRKDTTSYTRTQCPPRSSSSRLRRPH
jgi:hypothetical protein